MKRWTRRATLVLALGAVANLLIACGLTLWAPVLGHDSIHFEAAGRLWREEFSERAGRDGMLHLGIEFRHFGYGCREVESYPDDAVFERGRLAEAGWPMRSFSGRELETDDVHRFSFAAPAPALPDPLRPKDRKRRLLAFLPMWPGIVVNTLYYAVLVSVGWLAATWLVALRGHARRRRGLCPSCRYPIGSADRCSECGRGVGGRA